MNVYDKILVMIDAIKHHDNQGNHAIAYELSVAMAGYLNGLVDGGFAQTRSQKDLLLLASNSIPEHISSNIDSLQNNWTVNA